MKDAAQRKAAAPWRSGRFEPFRTMSAWRRDGQSLPDQRPFLNPNGGALMSPPPYMKLYIADYLAETTHLTAPEHGAYLLLLMAMWRADGKLPRDEIRLAKIARCSTEQWADVRTSVLEYFQVFGGTLRQRRVTKEIARYKAVVDGSRKAGKASAAKRLSKNRDLGSTVVGASVVRRANQPEPEPDRSIDLSSDAGKPPRARALKRLPEEPLPASFPLAEHIADAVAMITDAGVTLDAEAQAKRFRGHAKTHDRRVRDWPSAWIAWIGIEIEKAPKSAPVGAKAAAWSGPPEILAKVLACPEGKRLAAFLRSCDYRPTPPAVTSANAFAIETLQAGAGEALRELGVAIQLEDLR